MIVRSGVGDAKAQHDAIHETRLGYLGTDRSEVVAGGEHQFVLACNERVALQQRFVAAAVVVGDGGFQRAARVDREREELDLDARAGTPDRGVEQMGSELSHSQFSLCVCEVSAAARSRYVCGGSRLHVSGYIPVGELKRAPLQPL